MAMTTQSLSTVEATMHTVLKKRKQTLNAFLEDIEWAKEELRNQVDRLYGDDRVDREESRASSSSDKSESSLCDQKESDSDEVTLSNQVERLYGDDRVDMEESRASSIDKSESNLCDQKESDSDEVTLSNQVDRLYGDDHVPREESRPSSSSDKSESSLCDQKESDSDEESRANFSDRSESTLCDEKESDSDSDEVHKPSADYGKANSNYESLDVVLDDKELEYVSDSESDSSVVSYIGNNFPALAKTKKNVGDIVNETKKKKKIVKRPGDGYPYNEKRQKLSSEEESDSNEDTRKRWNKTNTGEVNECDIIRDKNNKGLYIKKQRTKTPKGTSKNDRFYDNLHACYFCGKVVLHINLHLQTRLHRKEELVKKVLADEKPDFTMLRKMGDDKHNRECIEKGEGQIILARRPKSNKFDVSQFGPCVICKEWVCLKGIKYHFNECKKQQHSSLKLKKRDLVIQSRILAGHIHETASPLLMKEVLPIMTNDYVSKVAQGDPLIMALGDSWVRRNMSNVEKRKYYASSRMRLVARMLIQLHMMKKSVQTPSDMNNAECFMEDSAQNDEKMSFAAEKQSSNTIDNSPAMFDFLRPSYFDDVVIATLRCSFPNADDMEELSAPSNALKLKYDIIRMVNSKWAFIVKKTDETNKHALECQAFLKLMDVQWKETVTVFAHAVLNRRRYEIVKELPSPEDIQILTQHLIKELKKTSCETENFQKLVVLAQARLLLYNKRRTGELEVVKLQSYASRSKGLDDLDESLSGDLTAVEKKLLESQDLMKI